MTLKLPAQVKDMAYRGLIQPAARVGMVASVAFAIAYAGSEYTLARSSPAARADGGLLFIFLLVLGLVIGIVSIAPALCAYWIAQAIRLLSKQY